MTDSLAVTFTVNIASERVGSEILKPQILLHLQAICRLISFWLNGALKYWIFNCTGRLADNDVYNIVTVCQTSEITDVVTVKSMRYSLK